MMNPDPIPNPPCPASVLRVGDVFDFNALRWEVVKAKEACEGDPTLRKKRKKKKLRGCIFARALDPKVPGAYAAFAAGLLVRLVATGEDAKAAILAADPDRGLPLVKASALHNGDVFKVTNGGTAYTVLPFRAVEDAIRPRTLPLRDGYVYGYCEARDRGIAVPSDAVVRLVARADLSMLDA